MAQPCAHRARAAGAHRAAHVGHVGARDRHLPLRRAAHPAAEDRARPASVVAAGALLVGAVAPPLAATFAPEVSQASVLRQAEAERRSVVATSPVVERTKAPTTAQQARPVKRIMIVGDSVALTLGRGIE